MVADLVILMHYICIYGRNGKKLDKHGQVFVLILTDSHIPIHNDSFIAVRRNM